MPTREISKSQHWFEVAPGQDPLAAADRLGRPVAILRLGGRLPDAKSDGGFFFGSPPYLPCPAPAAIQEKAKAAAPSAPPPAPTPGKPQP